MVSIAALHWYDNLGNSEGYGYELLLSDLGYWGLVSFFVLSGFLITRILLLSRDKAPTWEQRKHEIRQFYIRRFLRIFPLYYMVIFLAMLFGSAAGRQIFWWCVAYLTNFYIFTQQAYCGSFTHFWSLAVEEQYYLVWPWLIFLLPSRWIKPLLVGMILSSPLYRWGMVVFYPKVQFIHMLPISNFDGLGTGSLLACLAHEKRKSSGWIEAGLAWSVVAALVLFVLTGTFDANGGIYDVISPTLIALFFGVVVWRLSNGFTGWIGKTLEWPAFSFLGKVSYGFYVYHVFAYRIYDHITARYHVQMGIPLAFLLMFLLTLGMSWASWQLIEGPANNLKKYFPY